MDFDDIWHKYLKDSRIDFARFGFHVGLLVITLSSLKLHTENNTCIIFACQLLSATFLAAISWDADLCE